MSLVAIGTLIYQQDAVETVDVRPRPYETVLVKNTTRVTIAGLFTGMYVTWLDRLTSWSIASRFS